LCKGSAFAWADGVTFAQPSRYVHRDQAKPPEHVHLLSEGHVSPAFSRLTRPSHSLRHRTRRFSSQPASERTVHLRNSDSQPRIRSLPARPVPRCTVAPRLVCPLSHVSVISYVRPLTSFNPTDYLLAGIHAPSIFNDKALNASTRQSVYLSGGERSATCMQSTAMQFAGCSSLTRFREIPFVRLQPPSRSECRGAAARSAAHEGSKLAAARNCEVSSGGTWRFGCFTCALIVTVQHPFTLPR
jgi:hypothetical protein